MLMNEKLIEAHMKNLGISREEAIQLIADDLAIDRGAKMFDLDPELEKGAKKARQADRKPSSAPIKRERKIKPEKAQICDAMRAGLTSALGVEDFNVTNGEREFLFEWNGIKYKVTLACPRS
jgi:hypothetical protein